MLNSNTIVSGMRPTGIIHTGNYVGGIKPLLNYQKNGIPLNLFVANLHALTEVEYQTRVRMLTTKTTRLYIACGIDPKTTNFYRQSDIRSIPEIMLQLSMIASEGMLYRCTTYKDKAQQKRKGKEIISAGLFMYPVLMCADILSVRGKLVPVGHDQLQHIEMCRDIIARLNHMFNLSFPLPHCPDDYEPVRLPGLDGSGKMGKSLGNTISLLHDNDKITRCVLNAVTDNGTSSDEMSTPIKNLFFYVETFCPKEVYLHYLGKYQNGERKFYSSMKKELATYLCKFITTIRTRYHEDPACSEESALNALEVGQSRINPIADEVCYQIKNAMNY